MITTKLYLTLCETLLSTWQRTITKGVDINTEHITHTHTHTHIQSQGVGIMTQLWAGRPENCKLIRGSCQWYFSSRAFRRALGAHQDSCCTGYRGGGGSFLEGKAVGAWNRPLTSFKSPITPYACMVCAKMWGSFGVRLTDPSAPRASYSFTTRGRC